MNKRFVVYILTFVLLFTTCITPSFYVYASGNSNYDNFGSWEELNVIQKLYVILANGSTIFGKILSADALKADETLNDFINYVGSNYSTDPTVGDMTVSQLEAMSESEQDEWYKKYVSALEDMGATINENGLKMTDDACTKIRGWLDEYEKNNLQPLYYIGESHCISDLKASQVGGSYIYTSLKNFVEKYDYVIFRYYGSTSYFYVFNDYPNDVFPILYNTWNPNSYSAKLYSKETESNNVTFTYYSTSGLQSNGCILSFDDNGELVSSVDSIIISTNTTTTKLDMSYYFNYSKAGYELITKDKYNYKVFTSLANYQDYITSTYEPQVFYTTNYYKTENIQESAIPLDQMVNLYNCYDELCQKVLQYVKDTQNADDTAVIKKLDELIQAVYSTGSVPSGGSSGGSTDVTVNTDMSETNSILNKILEEIKKLHSTKIDIDTDTDNPLTDWAKKLSNMVKNPEININATVGDMGSVFTKVTDKLKCKFPFSIPWDIFFLLAFLADTPEVPKYEIPFKLENYGIDEVLVIDFEQFSVVSKISRMLLTILYMVALMNLTIKVLGIGKDK